MSRLFVFGTPSDSDERIMRAFKEAQFSRPHSEEKWQTAVNALFESLTPFQKDILGELLAQKNPTRKALVRLGKEWRHDRCEHDIDWVTRHTWPL
ncbi:MAG: hypothetical protein AAB421_00890 [Patescibacteria group bacterium]